jgi:hypothetical protein
MRSFKNILGVISPVLFAVIVFGAFSLNVNAQAYRGLVIDEIKYDMGYQDRGTRITKTFHVTHDFQDRTKVVTLYFRAADFTSDGATGTPVFLPKDTLSSVASLASWITFEKTSITLDHYGQQEEVTFYIDIPMDAEPGGKFAAILLSDKEGESAIDGSDESSELGISKELGPLVFLITDGDIRMSLIADSLYTTNIMGKKTQYFFNLPVFINAVLRNNGNVQVQPNGAIYLYRGDNFQDFITKYELNEKKGYVLPDSTRIFAFEWNEGFMYDELKKDEKTGKISQVTKLNWDQLSKFRIGKYNVKMLFSAESTEGNVTTIQKDTFFWVIPWPLIVLVVAIVVITGLYLTGKKLSRKKKNNRNTTESSAYQRN